MLKIRLQRIGKKGHAYFKLVVLEHTTKAQGKYLELLGSYDPHKKDMVVKADRIKFWLSKGAQMSETANNLLVGRKIIEGEKVTVWKPKAKKKGEESSAKAATPTAPKAEVKAKEVVVAPEPAPAAL